MLRYRAYLAVAVALAAAGCGTAATTASTGPVVTSLPSTSTTGASVSSSVLASPPVIGATTPTTRATATTKPTTSPTPTTARPAGGQSVEITLTTADDQKTVTIRVGDSVRLLLADSIMLWSNAAATPDGFLAPDPAPSPPPRGVLAIWTAVKAGSVTLKALGTPWCPAPMACPMYARLYQATVVVT